VAVDAHGCMKLFSWTSFRLMLNTTIILFCISIKKSKDQFVGAGKYWLTAMNRLLCYNEKTEVV
jgi:hypothetical protein